MIYTALFYLGPAASFISPPMFISVTLLQPDYFPTRRASSCLGVFVLALISAWRACSWISAWLNSSLPSCLCPNVTYSKALSDQPIVPSPKSSSTLTLSIHFFHAMIIMWYAHLTICNLLVFGKPSVLMLSRNMKCVRTWQWEIPSVGFQGCKSKKSCVKFVRCYLSQKNIGPTLPSPYS